MTKIQTNKYNSFVFCSSLFHIGAALAGVHLRHYNEYRTRCPKCSCDFCSSCLALPYHAGYTCQQFQEFKVNERKQKQNKTKQISSCFFIINYISFIISFSFSLVIVVSLYHSFSSFLSLSLIIFIIFIFSLIFLQFLMFIFQAASHCRFCNSALPPKVRGDVCGQQECLEKVKTAFCSVTSCFHILFVFHILFLTSCFHILFSHSSSFQHHHLRFVCFLFLQFTFCCCQAGVSCKKILKCGHQCGGACFVLFCFVLFCFFTTITRMFW